MSVSTQFSVDAAPTQTEAGSMKLELINGDDANRPCVCKVKVRAHEYSPRSDPYSVYAELAQGGVQMLRGYAEDRIKVESLMDEGIHLSIKKRGRREQDVVETVRFQGVQRQSVRYGSLARGIQTLQKSKFRDLTGGLLYAPGYVGDGEFEAAEPAYGVLVVRYTVQAQLFELKYQPSNPRVQFDVLQSQHVQTGLRVHDADTGAVVQEYDTVPGSAIGGGMTQVNLLTFRPAVIPQVELFGTTIDAASMVSFTPTVEIINESLQHQTPNQTIYEHRVRKKISANNDPNAFAEVDVVTERTVVNNNGVMEHQKYAQ